jgi:hypothetical protein
MGWNDMSRRSASLASAMAVVDNLAPISGCSTDPWPGISNPRRGTGESRSAAAYDKVRAARWRYVVRLYRLGGEQGVRVDLRCYRGRKVCKCKVQNANCTTRISNM